MNPLRHAPTAVRILLGLTFFVFGLNGFLGFLPQPPMPQAAGGFLGGLSSAPYFFPVLKGIEVTVGALLLANRFVPLALTVVAPIVVNIALFHVFLAPSPLMVAFLLASEIYLAWVYRSAFHQVLAARSAPATRGDVVPQTAAAVAK